MDLLSQFLMLLLLAVGISAAGIVYRQCPDRENILPCFCTEYSSGDINIEVTCRNVDDVDAVRRVLWSVRGIYMVSLRFEYSRLGSIPSNLFYGAQVTQLSFSNCVLKRMGDEGRSALEGLEEIIERLSVRYSFSEVNEPRFLNVSRLRYLKYLDIDGNNMKEVGNEWFAEGPTELKRLHISTNKITSLGDRAFAHLINIEQLWLGQNQIETLKRSMFPSPAVYLNTLQLHENRISSLPVDFFSNMPAMESVFIDGNYIQRIPEATWASVWSRLDVLSLDNNPLECDSHIEWTFKQKQPKELLTGKCASPYERIGVELKRIIDENKVKK